MAHLLFQNTIRFITLILIQVLVLNNIQFLGFINPYIYILAVISLPVKMPRWMSLLLAFGLGITIDMFTNTLGLHAFACVLLAFLRNPLINFFTTNEDNVNFTPSFRAFGIAPYIKFVVLRVLIHHFTLYYMEVFNFTHFLITAYRAGLSSLITISIILAWQMLKR
jgi:rod shape-determining protein MreD